MKNILLVEDNPFISDIYNIQFKKSGYKVDIARDCEMAREKLKTNYYDLLVLDIDFGQGKMNGFDLLRIIRKNPKTENIKVIVVSNFNKENYPDDSSSLGIISSFLKMETTSEELLNTIKEILK